MSIKLFVKCFTWSQVSPYVLYFISFEIPGSIPNIPFSLNSSLTKNPFLGCVLATSANPSVLILVNGCILGNFPNTLIPLMSLILLII